MKKTYLPFLIIVLFIVSCNNSSKNEEHVVDKVDTNIQSKTEVKGVIQMNNQSFRELVFDYTASNQWNFQGDKPCIVDFYADWCRPCRIIAPILDELALQYHDKINIYKVNVDYEVELAQVFDVRSIPAIMFCRTGEQPVFKVGAYSKSDYIQFIESLLLK